MENAKGRAGTQEVDEILFVFALRSKEASERLQFTRIDNPCILEAKIGDHGMHVSLTEKLDEYVREKVASGLYNNASEVIREALRLKIAADETNEARLQRLRDAIDPAWQQAEQGDFADYSLDRSLARLRSGV